MAAVVKLLILSDLHLESEPFELPQGIDFDVAILAGDIFRPGRLGVNWARSEFGPGAINLCSSCLAITSITAPSWKPNYRSWASTAKARTCRYSMATR